jgi:hypothetical protein
LFLKKCVEGGETTAPKNENEGETTPRNKKKKRIWLRISTVALILLGISVGALLLMFAPWFQPKEMPYLTTTLVIIFGTTTLLSSLTVATVMFKRLGLTDKEEALGLPEGSVRALIALILIIIFAIMVIFLHADMTVSPLKYENGTYITDVNGTILYEQPPLDAQIDFSKQVLTTVSTLVVAIAGFYFGTKAVKAAKPTEEKPMLLMSPSGSMKLAKNDTLPIKVGTSPSNEKINWNIDPPTKGSIVLEDNEFKFKPSDASQPGDIIKLTGTLAKYTSISKQLEITIT